MDYQLIALDIDGTLLNSKGQLTPRVVRSVHRATEHGWRVCLVTGRRPRQSQPVAQALGITTPLVAFNGATITDPLTLKPLRSRYLEARVADSILRDWEEAGISAFTYRDTRHGPDVYYSHLPVWPQALAYIEVEGANMCRVESVATPRPWEPLRLMVMDDESIAKKAQRLADPHARADCTRTYLSQHYDRSWFFEVYPLTSKADGLQFLCSHFGIAPEQVVAVGDNVNDLDMLSVAGLGVAMGNGTQQCKEAADLVIGHHDEDGLAHFLDELIQTSAAV